MCGVCVFSFMRFSACNSDNRTMSNFSLECEEAICLAKVRCIAFKITTTEQKVEVVDYKELVLFHLQILTA